MKRHKATLPDGRPWFAEVPTDALAGYKPHPDPLAELWRRHDHDSMCDMLRGLRRQLPGPTNLFTAFCLSQGYDLDAT